MIAQIIYELLADKFSDKLSPKKNFFLEKAVGNEGVVIKTIATKNPIKSIDNMRFTKLHILINGWKVNDAMIFANEIVKYIERVRGEHTLNGDTCLIKEISTAPYPFPVDASRTDASQVVSFGIGIYYI